MSRFRITAILLLLFVGVSSASANTLVSTSPISGSTLSISPTNVTITGQVPLLADAPDANSITVTDPNGARVDDGTISISDLSAIVGIKPLTESGMYTVTYSLASEGEVALEGSFTFIFKAPSVISTTDVMTNAESQKPRCKYFLNGLFPASFPLIFGLFLKQKFQFTTYKCEK